MTFTYLPVAGLIQILIFIAVLLTCVKPLGGYIAKVYSDQPIWLEKLLGPVERWLYVAAGIDPHKEMNAKQYALSVLVFSFFSFITLYLLLRLQGSLPFNPQGLPGLSPDLAFNVAASFLTNTNWQSYSGEVALSYLSQMVGLSVHNFLSAAVGMAVLFAIIRGFASKAGKTVGNFWSDLVRGNLYILLPLSLVLSLLLVSQGVVQTLSPYIKAEIATGVLPGEKTNAASVQEQLIATGPAASQVAIKQLGTNGGGFFNANSAHPYENPTPFSNFLELVSILLIPIALCYSFGKMVNDLRQGWALLIAMTVIFLPLMFFLVFAEQGGNPRLAALGIDQQVSEFQSGGNMEGKETRFGITNSALWAAATTAASNGSVNAMHDSFTPLGIAVPMIFMQFGEVIYGGVGSGLYGMLIFVIITVFIAGLMVGRTPEYLGKKIQAFEIKMASIAILIPPLVVLVGAAIAVSLEAGRAGMFNPGAQGFSEILYAFASAGNNNGSALAGLSANTPFYNSMLGIIMLFGRFWVMFPVLMIAGALSEKHSVPSSAGTLTTHTPLFVGLLIGVIVLVGVLTFLPALALGPIAEHLHLLGK